jgi:hypothetical protein
MKTLFGYTIKVIDHYGKVTAIHDDCKPPTIPEGCWEYLPHDDTHLFHEATGWYRCGPGGYCFMPTGIHSSGRYRVSYLDGQLCIGDFFCYLPLAEAIRVAKALVLGP